MGYRRAAERALAIKLRQQGKSYNEIRKAVGVPSKGTISVWLRGIELTSSAKARLKDHMEKATKRGLLKFNTERSARIKQENENEYSLGLSTFQSLSDKDLLLLGVALYWGEGTKNITTSKLALSLSNSDPKMIAAFMQFLRRILKVPDQRICGGIHLYDGTSDEAGRKYWSNVTGLPKERFYISRQISKASRGKRNPKLLPYGTADIRVNDRKLFSRMKGMIDSLAEAAK